MTGTLWRHCRTHVKHALLGAFAIVRKLDRRAGNAVLLTFDDGPNPEVTPAVLDRLQAFQARAVFFIVGYLVRRAPEILRRMLAEGHLLGNHTYYHFPSPKGSLLSYIQDLKKCQESVAAATGQKPKLFRPPLGSLTARNLLAPKLLRLKSIYWSVESADWSVRSREDAVECGKRLCSQVRPGDILLLHDYNPHVLTVLDVLLPSLASRGWNLGSGVRTL